jgi:ABC-2 type transport system permease protein
MAEHAAIGRESAWATTWRGPSLARMLGNETTKSLLVLWAKRATLVPELAVLVVFFLFVQFFIGSGRLVEALYAPTLLGFAAYALAYIVTLKMVAGTLDELNSGTLEQVHLSPLPAWALSVGRLGAAVIEAVSLTALVSGALILVLRIQFKYQLDALVPLVLTILDVAGFGLLLGGLALRVPSIGAILHVMQGIVLFLNGSFVPVSLFPAWLQLVARLLPTTLGVEVSRTVLLQGRSLSTAWFDHSLLWLLIHSAAMLLIGGAVYQSSIWRALRDGRLGPR